MGTAITLITPPVQAAISLAEAKAHLRVDHDTEDDLITALVAAAISHLDGWTGILGRALEAQTWEIAFDRFPPAELRLPLGPVVSVTSVKYDDDFGIEQTVAAEDYELDGRGIEGWILPVAAFSWPTTMDTFNAVRVRWVAGTGCPPAVKQALLMLVGYWYTYREAAGAGIAAIPLGVAALLTPWRRTGI